MKSVAKLLSDRNARVVHLHPRSVPRRATQDSHETYTLGNPNAWDGVEQINRGSSLEISTAKQRSSLLSWPRSKGKEGEAGNLPYLRINGPHI